MTPSQAIAIILEFELWAGDHSRKGAKHNDEEAFGFYRHLVTSGSPVLGFQYRSGYDKWQAVIALLRRHGLIADGFETPSPVDDGNQNARPERSPV